MQTPKMVSHIFAECDKVLLVSASGYPIFYARSLAEDNATGTRRGVKKDRDELGPAEEILRVTNNSVNVKNAEIPRILSRPQTKASAE